MPDTSYISASKLAALTGLSREHITRLGRQKKIPCWIPPKKERSPCRFLLDAELQAWIATEQSKPAMTPAKGIRRDEQACLKTLAEALAKLFKDRRWVYWKEPKLRAYQKILAPLRGLEEQISMYLAEQSSHRNNRPISAKLQAVAADYQKVVETNREAVTPSSDGPRPSRLGGGSGRR